MDTIVLDNGIEYAIVKNEVINNILYTMFANVNDNTDICFRKTITKNGEDYYIGLDDDNEYDLVVAYFAKNLLKEIDG
jgi:hypothetical protein